MRMSPRKPQKDSRNPSRQKADSGAGGGQIWLYGNHPVRAALDNPHREIRRILGTADALRELGPLPRHLAAETVDRQRLDQMLPPGAVHQGLALLVAPLPDLDITEACSVVRGERNLVVVLDQVTDPHNVGAILRSAAAFGAKAVVMTDRHAPPASPALAKSASGALEVVPMVRVTNLARAMEHLAQLGYWRVGLDADAPRTLAAARPSGPIALVLGAEGEGMRRLTREACDEIVKLPISGAVESLNVSNAAAIALYEVVREAE